MPASHNQFSPWHPSMQSTGLFIEGKNLGFRKHQGDVDTPSIINCLEPSTSTVTLHGHIAKDMKLRLPARFPSNPIVHLKVLDVLQIIPPGFKLLLSFQSQKLGWHYEEEE